MSEPLFTLQSDTKAARYEQFMSLYTPFIASEDDLITALANTAAALHEAFGFFWVGFYLVKPSHRQATPAAGQKTKGHDEHLQLGPFQGPPACTQIRYGHGVCGTAWQQARTLVVPDVEQFPGHIACSSLSRSEIVVPVRDASGRIRAVLDIDSTRLSDFDETDSHWLQQVVHLLAETFTDGG